MGVLLFRDDYALSIAVGIVIIICLASISHWFTSDKNNVQKSPPSQSEGKCANKEPLSALQQHVVFWDRDNDNIIYPQDVYTGFREIGFSIPFALTALLIPIFFSYPTRLGHSYIPDPLFRIYVSSIHKAKHGSDTGAYDLKGNFRPQFFDAMFTEFDPTGTGGLGAMDLWRMICNNRVAADVAGWSFAAMEWSTTWLLLQREGRVWKDDLRQCYDGTIFWQLRQEGIDGVQPTRGYGWKEGFRDMFGRLPSKLKNSTARNQGS